MAKKLEGDNMPSAPLLLFTAVISLLLCIGEGFFCVVFLLVYKELDSVPPSLGVVFFLCSDYEGFLTFPVVFSMFV